MKNKRVTLLIAIALLSLVTASIVYFITKNSYHFVITLLLMPYVLMALTGLELLYKRIYRYFKRDYFKRLKREVDAAIYNGKKPYYFTSKKHLVYAQTYDTALKLYNNKVLPAVKQHPKKRFEYISETFNNLPINK